MYHYWGFELNIASEIEFPELLPAEFEQADVVIRLGSIPEAIQSDPASGAVYEQMLHEQAYYLDVKKVCKYYVTNGRDVLVDPYEGMEGRSVRIYLLATVMAVVLLQRGSIPLHASGILKEGELILFTGDSGAGKSTTLAYMVSSGYRIFTDDVCVLKTGEDGRVLGVASYPMIKLWDDALIKLDNDAYRDKTFRINTGMDKYGYFFHDTFSKEAYPISKLFILKKTTEAVVSVRELTGVEAFQQLERQVYRSYLIMNQQLRMLHFRTISTLLQHCTVYELSRPEQGTVAQVAEQLENLF